LRRLYDYVLALLGLVASFAGLQFLLSALVDRLLGAVPPEGLSDRDRLAAGLAALAVGLPLWILAWRRVGREAALEGEVGDRARRSLVRKTYLYLVLFVAVIGVMFSTGVILFQLLSALLGQPPENLLEETLQQARLLLLYGLLLGFHAWALRSDNRLAERSLARRHAQYPVLVLAPDAEGGPADFGPVVANALLRQASGLPVAIHAYSQGVPDESLAAARVVILPAELSARPSEAFRLWLQAFEGLHLVIPTPARDWHWVFGSGRSLNSLANQAARVVRQLAEGEEIDLPREASPWMFLVYLAAGLFALEIVLFILALVLPLVLGLEAA
jgi:hypothetical protein